MDTEYKFGLTPPDTKVTGKMTRLMAMASLLMLMVMFMKENGNLIKQMERVSTSMQTEPSSKESGKMINSMDRVLNSGQMVQII